MEIEIEDMMLLQDGTMQSLEFLEPFFDGTYKTCCHPKHSQLLEYMHLFN